MRDKFHNEEKQRVQLAEIYYKLYCDTSLNSRPSMRCHTIKHKLQDNDSSAAHLQTKMQIFKACKKKSTPVYDRNKNTRNFW